MIGNTAPCSDYSHLFVHFDVTMHAVAVIGNRVREMGGEIIELEVLPSDEPHHGIAHFTLANEDVRGMVIELSENELFDVQGLNRRASG